ncbi:MAG TPA: hypothetical protein VJ183_09540 [Chloroflexia bacterium]|nr:hypothetical protein [Chloroflexia bacterium]
MNGDKIIIRCGVGLRLWGRPADESAGYTYEARLRGLARVTPDDYSVRIHLYYYDSIPGGELWAWRSYQGRIDLRCAVVSNVECGVRSAE